MIKVRNIGEVKDLVKKRRLVKRILKKLTKRAHRKYVKQNNLSVKKNALYLRRMYLLKEGALWTHLRKINYYLILKFTLNNFFAYVYNREVLGRNMENLKKLLKRRSKEAVEQDKAVVKCIYRSLGTVGFKGPAKKGDIAMYTVGKELGKRLFERRVRHVNLIIRNKMTRKVREFFRGLKEYKIKFHYIYVIPKFAHNGCRLRKRKRL